MASCPHCLAGKPYVDIEGRRFHTSPDRWLSCPAKPGLQSEPCMSAPSTSLSFGFRPSALPHCKFWNYRSFIKILKS